jgi:subfamily B ATP-binding cassette protein HlyB/CyaB
MDTMIETVRNTAALEAIRSVLETHVLFNVLPTAEKRAIELLLEVRQVPAGKKLFNQGAAADGMYVIHGGSARLKENTGGKLVSVGLIGTGATIGQTSLLEETKWPYQVVAETAMTMVCLRADRARLLVSESRIVDEHFKRYVGLVEVGERLRTLLGGANYTAEEFSDMLSKMGVKRIRVEAAVFNQGDNDPRLYFLESGNIELIRAPISGEPISLSRCSRGTLFGEMGALPRRTPRGIQTYTARALTDVTVLVIYQHTVERILNLNPELQQRLIQRARDVEQLEADEIAARKRAEGVDLRIKLAEGLSEDEFRATSKTKETTKLAVVRQNAQADAAAACLAMTMGFYGRKFTLGQMQEVTGLNTPETTPDAIIRGAETLGFRVKGYSIPYASLKTVRLPAILGWQGYHWILLLKVSDKEVEIADPASGIRKIKRDEFLTSWTAADVAGVVDRRPDCGVMIALEPTVKFEKEEEAKSSIRHFINYILPYKKYYGEAVLAAVVINVLGLASPLFVQTIVDNVVVHHDVGLLNMMLGGMVLVAVLTTAMSVVQSLLLAHTTSRLDMRLMSEFYRHVLSLPMDFFLTKNKGEILARFGENQKIRAILTGSTITVLMNTLMIVLYFLMMFAYSVPLSLIVVFFIPLYRHRHLLHAQDQSHRSGDLRHQRPVPILPDRIHERDRGAESHQQRVLRPRPLGKLLRRERQPQLPSTEAEPDVQQPVQAGDTGVEHRRAVDRRQSGDEQRHEHRRADGLQHADGPRHRPGDPDGQPVERASGSPHRHRPRRRRAEREVRTRYGFQPRQDPDPGSPA